MMISSPPDAGRPLMNVVQPAWHAASVVRLLRDDPVDQVDGGEISAIRIGPDYRFDRSACEASRYAASIVATWAEFADAEPDLAAFGRERMAGRIVYQA